MATITLRLPDGVPTSEVSVTFLQGMVDRMGLSYFKYGLVEEAYGPRVVNRGDALRSMRKRLDKYRETGNTEWLMDAANFDMIEFMFPDHEEAHFRPTDADESPGRIVNGSATALPNAEVHERA